MREIQASAAEPPWLGEFRDTLRRADLAPATVQGYLKDIRHFLRWRTADPELPDFPALSGDCRAIGGAVVSRV